MSDLELLFLILTLIYLWECACWLPRGSVAFRTWLGRRWRPAHPGVLLGNQRGGFVFAHPLPPLGTILIGTQIPISISTDGVLAFVSAAANPAGRPAQDAKFLRFDQIQSVSVKGKRVLLSGDVFVKAASTSLATKLARQVQDIAKLAPQKRAEAIASLIKDSLDTTMLEKRWEQFRSLTRNLRLLTNAVFALLFFAAPLLIWQFGFRVCWTGLLLCLLTLAVSTAISFRRAHKALYPDAEEQRFTQFLTVLLSPATTTRALDILSRPLLEDFHPVAIARTFCAEQEFRAFAQRALLELRHPAWPLCPNDDLLAKAAEESWRSVLLEVVEKFLKRNRLDPATLLQPPVGSDHTCLAYCPRCRAQFTTVTGVCDDCGGLPMVTFQAR